MKISFVETKTNCPIAVVDNFFSEIELKSIKDEILFLVKKIEEENELSDVWSSAKNTEGGYKREGKTLFLDRFFCDNRHESSILQANRKIFADQKLQTALEKKSIFYRSIRYSNKDWTLLNVYKKNDYYKKHADASLFTLISFFDVSEFSGGNFLFPEFNVALKATDNRTVIFPGFLEHEVEKITKGTRVSLAHFINY